MAKKKGFKAPPKPDRPWWDYISEINRLQYAIQDFAGLGDPSDQRTPLEYLYRPLPEPDKRPTFERALEGLGMQEGIARTGLGIAGDIISDPLTYATFGGSAVVGKADDVVKLGAKIPFLSTRVPLGSSKAAGRAIGAGIKGLKGLGPVKALRRVFTYAPKLIDENFPGFLAAARKSAGLTQSIDNLWQKFALDHLDDIAKAAKSAGMGVPEAKALLFEAIERPNTVVPKALEGLAPKASQAFAKMLKDEKVLMNSAELTDAVVDYARRVKTSEFSETLASVGINNSEDLQAALRKAVPPGTSARTLREMSTAEANELLRGVYGVKKAFHTDPALAVLERGRKSAAAIGKATFLDDVAKKWGGSVGDDIAPEIVERMPQLKGVKLPPEIAEYVNRAAKFASQDEKTVFGWYDKILNVFKRHTLIPWPAYHFRNLVSNIMQANLMGVDGLDAIKSYTKAAKMMNPSWLGGAAKGAVKVGGKTYKSADEFLEFATKNNVFGRGMMAAEAGAGKLGDVAVEFGDELPRAFGSEGVGKLADSLSRYTGHKVWMKNMDKLGITVEDGSRLAAFIHFLDKGDDAATASGKVATALFNYNEVPEGAAKWLGRAAPFFRWTYFNWPYQVKRLAAEPGKFAMLSKVASGLGNRMNVPEGKLPTFIVEGLGVPVKDSTEDTDKQSYFLFRNWIGPAELAEIAKPLITAAQGKGSRETFRAAAQPILERLSPMIKTPIEYYSNYSLYFQDEIERYPGEKTQFLGLHLTKHQATLLRNIRILNEFDRTFPWERIGVDRGKRVDLPEIQRAIRFATGARLYPVSRTRALNEAKWARIQELSEARKAFAIAEKRGFPEEQARTLENLLRLDPDALKRKKRRKKTGFTNR